MRKWQEGEEQLGRATANSSPGTWQSIQTPWLCECVCSCECFFFSPLVYHDSWMKINLLLHLPSWVLGSADGPSLSHWAGSKPTQVFPPLLSYLHSLSSLLLSFPFPSSPLLSSPCRCQNLKRIFFFLLWHLQVTLTADVCGFFFLLFSEAAIWALITLIDGSEGPCCSSEWQIKAFLDNVGNWLNRL